jgi:uncharacterized membrane protein (UPF0136 family)
VNIPIFALARFDLILPLRVLILVLAGLRAATSILIYHLLKKVIARPIAMLAALYWAFDYYIHWTAYQQGLETGLAAFCLVLLLFLLQRFERDRKFVPVNSKGIATLALVAVLVMLQPPGPGLPGRAGRPLDRASATPRCATCCRLTSSL